MAGWLDGWPEYQIPQSWYYPVSTDALFDKLLSMKENWDVSWSVEKELQHQLQHRLVQRRTSQSSKTDLWKQNQNT